VRSSTTARAGRPFTAVLETARIPERDEDVKQKALRIADLLLAGLRPRRTAPNPREKSS
jgi:hypothetical protein